MCCKVIVSSFEQFEGWTHWNHCLFFPSNIVLRVKKGKWNTAGPQKKYLFNPLSSVQPTEITMPGPTQSVLMPLILHVWFADRKFLSELKICFALFLFVAKVLILSFMVVKPKQKKVVAKNVFHEGDWSCRRHFDIHHKCQALPGPSAPCGVSFVNSRGFKPWCGSVAQRRAIVVADQRLWSDLKFLNKLLMDCKSHSLSPQDTARWLGPSSFSLFLLWQHEVDICGKKVK